MPDQPEPSALRQLIAKALYAHHYGSPPTGDTWRGTRNDYLAAAQEVIAVILPHTTATAALWRAAEAALELVREYVTALRQCARDTVSPADRELYTAIADDLSKKINPEGN